MLCLVCQEMIEDARARAGATKCAQCDGQQPEGTMSIPETAAPDVSQRTPLQENVKGFPPVVELDAPDDRLDNLRSALAEVAGTLSRAALELHAISDFAETL